MARVLHNIPIQNAGMMQIDIMGELIKVFLDFVRKQAGMVVVLIFICLAMGWLILDQKREILFQTNTVNKELRASIANVSERLHACEDARSRLVVQVEVLKVKAEWLETRVDELRRRGRK